MDMSFNFILQAMRVLNVGHYDEDELHMIYNYLVALDNDILNDYNSKVTVLSYSNDLELYMEILDVLIDVFETREEYEKCAKLKTKKDESLKIIKTKK